MQHHEVLAGFVMDFRGSAARLFLFHVQIALCGLSQLDAETIKVMVYVREICVLPLQCGLTRAL